MTGLAQVEFRYACSVDDLSTRLSYDLFYIKHYSLWLDLTILFKTIRVVVKGTGW